MQRLTRGRLGHDYLLKAINSADPMAPRRKAKRFRESDKVKSLEGGSDWYSYLKRPLPTPQCRRSPRPSYLGGVKSNSTALDQLAFAEFLGYLAHQILVMTSHAALTPTTNPETDPFLKKAFALIGDRRAAAEGYRNAMTTNSPPHNHATPD